MGFMDGLLNEENHPWNAGITAKDEIVAINYAHDTIESWDSQFEIIVNVVADLAPDWQGYMKNWLDNGAGDSIDILAIDHYPDTWTVFTDARDWGALDSLFELCDQYHKKGAIMETGFSTWAPEDTKQIQGIPYWHTEDDQKNYINTALPIVYNKTFEHNSASSNKLIMATWYNLRNPKRLYDRYILPIGFGILAGFDFDAFEANFGIINTEFKPKLAYPSLVTQINNFYCPRGV